MRTGRELQDGAILRPAALTGPGWVFATVGRLTYQRRLGFARYDIALSAEDDVLVLRSGWRFVGSRRRVPMVEVLAEGWVPRPGQLHRG